MPDPSTTRHAPAATSPWPRRVAAVVFLATVAQLVLATIASDLPQFEGIRHGTELDTAYEDTLFDEVLGSLGAALAGVAVARRR